MSFPFDVCVPHRHKGGLYQLMMITLQIKKAHLKAQKEGLFFQNALKFGFSGRIFVRRFALFASDLRLVTFFGTGDGGLFHILFASLGSPPAQGRDPGASSATFGRPRAQGRNPGACFATFGSSPAQSRDPGASSATSGRSRARSRDSQPRSATLGGPQRKVAILAFCHDEVLRGWRAPTLREKEARPRRNAPQRIAWKRILTSRQKHASPGTRRQDASGRHAAPARSR